MHDIIIIVCRFFESYLKMSYQNFIKQNSTNLTKLMIIIAHMLITIDICERVYKIEKRENSRCLKKC